KGGAGAAQRRGGERRHGSQLVLVDLRRPLRVVLLLPAADDEGGFRRQPANNAPRVGVFGVTVVRDVGVRREITASETLGGQTARAREVFDRNKVVSIMKCHVTPPSYSVVNDRRFLSFLPAPAARTVGTLPARRPRPAPPMCSRPVKMPRTNPARTSRGRHPRRPGPNRRWRR